MIEYRPLPDAAINKLGQYIIDDDLPPTEQAQQLQDLLLLKLNEFCPMKSSS